MLTAAKSIHYYSYTMNGSNIIRSYIHTN